jgi:hypothetical protein
MASFSSPPLDGARLYPTLEVSAVDASAAMLAELHRRVTLRSPRASVVVHDADLRISAPPRDDFDLVIAHFFFDCFTSGDIASMGHTHRTHARARPALAGFGLRDPLWRRASICRPVVGARLVLRVLGSHRARRETAPRLSERASMRWLRLRARRNRSGRRTALGAMAALSLTEAREGPLGWHCG